MKRRNFLETIYSCSGLLILNPNSAFNNMGLNQQSKQTSEIKKVHLIFKTHLDIGFTDLAENVINRYVEHFIPSALSLAEKLRKNEKQERFVWTTGSWLIYEYLERCSTKARIRMENAIEAGDIVWHGLPFTMHSELIDDSLFLLGCRISVELDKRFGKKTIAAKMTDVPAHSIGIVSQLFQSGLSFLHIGINPASTPPKVPPLFNWQSTDGSEITVMYQMDYGSVMILPGTDTAVAISFTGDNHGPQSPDAVAKIYNNLKRRFPDAVIKPSSLNAIAEDVNKIRGSLPVVTQELGDTWIHGVASDPWKITRFRELCRLRKQWLKSRKFSFGDTTDLKFGIPLLKIAEHTWGLDVKTHLKNWDIYTESDLATARSKPEFQKIEKSWQEKRSYLDEAINALPDELSKQARTKLNKLQPIEPSTTGFEKLAFTEIEKEIDTTFFTVALDAKTGAIIKLHEKNKNRDWASTNNPLALFAYQTFSKDDYDRFFDLYLTRRPYWAIADFGKPGMEKFNPQSATWLPTLKEVLIKRNKEGTCLLIKSEVLDEKGSQVGGCPRLITTKIEFPQNSSTINIKLLWFNKPAYRLPEALWFSFVPVVRKPGRWVMDKMGKYVDPLNVIENGNRKLHGVIKGVQYANEDSKFEIKTLDAPLVAPGERSLLNFDNKLPKPEDGMHFLLCNNVWGTNFTMWFYNDMRFRFQVRI